MRSHGKQGKKVLIILAMTLKKNRNAKLINMHEDWEQKCPEELLKHIIGDKAKKQKGQNNNFNLSFFMKI